MAAMSVYSYDLKTRVEHLCTLHWFWVHLYYDFFQQIVQNFFAAATKPDAPSFVRF